MNKNMVAKEMLKIAKLLSSASDEYLEYYNSHPELEKFFREAFDRYLDENKDSYDKAAFGFTKTVLMPASLIALIACEPE